MKAAYTLAPEGMFVNAPSPFICPASKYLLAILNSKLADYYIRKLGVTRNGGYFEYKPMFIEQVPVPRIETKVFDKLVDDRKEDEIDRKVFELYGLLKEEIKFIESL